MKTSLLSKPKEVPNKQPEADNWLVSVKDRTLRPKAREKLAKLTLSRSTSSQMGSRKFFQKFQNTYFSDILYIMFFVLI